MRSTAFNPESVWSYVAGSYVDFVSQSGAMPVLIPYDVTEEHLDYFIDTLDMFLLPGGGAAIQQKVNPSDAKFTATEF
jgi:gamma-glutamyl-gamma-aminobutyrate hydrolase PuuD